MNGPHSGRSCCDSGVSKNGESGQVILYVISSSLILCRCIHVCTLWVRLCTLFLCLDTGSTYMLHASLLVETNLLEFSYHQHPSSDSHAFLAQTLVGPLVVQALGMLRGTLSLHLCMSSTGARLDSKPCNAGSCLLSPSLGPSINANNSSDNN